MAVLINFKICDNAKECGGIEVCPTGALSYDEENETIKIDNDKCISCGDCERMCPIGAIKVARTKEEYDKYKEEIDSDPRTTKDLFVDRYGAAPLSEFFMINSDELEGKLTDNIVLVEVYSDDSIECLLKSIPIKEITKELPDTTLFYKVEATDELKEKYNISTLPSLLVFNNRELVNKIEGYYTVDKKDELISLINNTK